jgi:hypothetical protein
MVDGEAMASSRIKQQTGKKEEQTDQMFQDKL